MKTWRARRGRNSAWERMLLRRGESRGMYSYYRAPVHTLLKIPRPEYGQLANNIRLATNKEAQFQKQATDSLTGMKKLVGPDSAIADKLMRFAVGVNKPGEYLAPAEQT